MFDLISFLTAHFLEETIGGGTPPSESDTRLQQLESLLALEGTHTELESSPEENRLLRAYLNLSIEELESLSPEVHEWFIERLALRVPVQMQREPREVVRQIGRLFFLSERGTQQYLVVGALLAVDERTESQEESSVAFIWDHIWRDEGLTGIEKEGSISTVAEILLDQHYFCRRSRYPIRALAQLLRSEARFLRDRPLETRPASGRVVARVHLVGETLGSDLASLLREI